MVTFAIRHCQKTKTTTEINTTNNNKSCNTIGDELTEAQTTLT